jgi:hypothetical protein
MDACPLLITSIVAVKPEDQGTFFQDFLGLSGYLCSIGGFYSNTALLRTRNAQNHNEAQRDCRKTPGSKNVHKNLPQQAKKCQNVAQMLCGTPKTRHFSAFLSHFSKIIFEKRLIRQSQRFALCPFGVLVGGTR